MSELDSIGNPKYISSEKYLEQAGLKAIAESAKKAKEKKIIDQQSAHEAQEKQKEAFKVKGADVIAAQADEQRKESAREAEAAEKQQQAARDSQQQYIQGLKAQAAGTTDTAAQRALQLGADRSAAQQNAIAASQAGATSAGLRGQARAAAQGGQQTLQASNQLKVQEQLAARQQLAQALGQQRQQDFGAQQVAAQGQQQGLSDQQKLALLEQQASASGETQKVGEYLANKGIQTQSDISDMQASGGQRSSILSGVGAIAGGIIGGYFTAGTGTAAGVAGGASLGAGLGQMLNKGGKVAEDKKSKNTSIPKNLSKEEKFGFKKALESNTNNDSKYAEGGTVNRNMTAGEMPKNIAGGGIDIEAIKKQSAGKDTPFKDQYQEASTIKDIDKFKQSALDQTLKSGDQRRQALLQGLETRNSQTALSDQFRDQTAGNGPSLANLQLKSKGDASLAQQLAAAQSGKSPVAAAQLQQALAQTQQQQAGSIAQQAAQLAAQESQQAYQSGLGVDYQTRAADLSQSGMAQQLQQQQLMQEASIRQAEQEAAKQYLGLQIDKKAALEGLKQSKKAAKAGSKKGLLSGLFNAGGEVPGKPNVPGDHVKNDIVPAMLSPGEIVIPRTVVDKGSKAMIGFIKGIEQMTKGKKASEGGKMEKIATKVRKYNTGGEASNLLETEEEKKKKEEEKKKESNKVEIKTDKPEKQEYTQKEKADEAAKGQAGMAIASQAGEMLGNAKKAKNAALKKLEESGTQDFKSALSRIKARSNYAKGGKVSSCGYGAVLEAKNKKKGK